MSILQLFVNL